MRRILSSIALLTACLGMAACGSSSSSSNPTYLGSLSGNYVFQEQVYSYFSGATDARPPSRMTAKPLHMVKKIGGGKPLAAAFHPHSSSSHAVPAQGSVDSSIYWGAMVGALTFDGLGDVTGGEIDYNEPLSVGYFADTATGTYTINSDNTATIDIISTNVGDEFYFDVALQGIAAGSGSVAQKATLVEAEEDSLGNIEIGTGTMLASSGASESSINGNYVFGLQGQTCYGSPCPQVYEGDLYAAGLLSANGSGAFGGSSQADVSDGFGSGNLSLSGSYVAPDTMGRAAASLSSSGDVNAGALPAGYILYIANSSTFFVLSTDNNNTSTGVSPYLFGTANLQSGTPSLAGNYVFAESTEDLQNENSNTPDTYSDTYLALLSANGNTFTGTGDSNKAGVITSTVPYNYGGFTVSNLGRVSFTGSTPSGSFAPVFWLTGSGFGYGVDQLAGNATQQEPGLIYLYAQNGSSFSASSLSGLYAVGNLPGSTSNAGLAIGTVTSDGSSNLSGDVALISFGDNNVGSATATYTVATNGRGVATGGSGSLFGNYVFYIVSPSLSVGMDVTSGDSAPSIQTLQQ